jgi:amino acid transporter
MDNLNQADQGHLRRGELGTRGIVFLVLAAAAPMGAIVVTVPLSMGFGTGVGTPGAYLTAGIVLLLFSVGYVAMSRHVTNAGAFYAYVTRGLGRPAGLVTAMIALLAYNAMVIGTMTIPGVFIHEIAIQELGLDLPWQVWSGIIFVTVAALSCFEIHLSAVVLGVALVAEVLILLVLDVAILADRGPGEFPARSFSPAAVFAGGAGVSLMYAFSSFVGFEATAIYGEEAREPRRTVPRATYVSVGIIAVFYGLTTWSLVAAYGAGSVAEAAAADPVGFVFTANQEYVGGFGDHLMNLLICTSLFAAVLAFHNGAARYMYAIARDGLLPRRLTRTHPRHGSPYVASAVQLSLTAVVITAFALARVDPLLELGAAFLGLGTLGIIMLQGLGSFSVVGFFRDRPDRHPWKTLVAPLLGGLGLATAAVLVIVNYSALTGSPSDVVNNLWWLYVLAVALGVLLTGWLRRARPDTYRALAHSEPWFADDAPTDSTRPHDVGGNR